MAPDCPAKLREMTKYLIELEGEKQAALSDIVIFMVTSLILLANYGK